MQAPSQTMNMNTENVEIDLLSDNELDAVAGGEQNLVTAFVKGFLHTSGEAGIASFRRAIADCL
jgi:hypothetical protein